MLRWANGRSRSRRARGKRTRPEALAVDRAHFFLSWSAFHSAEREGAVQNKVRHPFRSPHGISEGHGAALGYSEERETLDAGRIDDGLEIAHQASSEIVSSQSDMPLPLAS
jgi:hypothetical protein